MTILALADIHGDTGRIPRMFGSNPSTDVIIIAGDLTTKGSPSDVKEMIRLFRESGKPVLAVAGNMDTREIDSVLVESGVSINGRGVIIGEAGFFGVSASPISPLRTPYEIPEEEIEVLAMKGWKDVAHAKFKVFVPHAPPHGTSVDVVHGGKHVGSFAVRDFIERQQPDVVICGHIHEARGTDVIGKSKIMNCGQGGRGYYGLIGLGNEIHVECRE